VDVQLIKRVGALVSIVERFESRQRVFLVVEFDSYGIVDLLLKVIRLLIHNIAAKQQDQ
jgi:hypothetical protein